MFDSILVANRGEIALRIMRTAQAMGIQTIAIYVDADKDAPHVRFADKAVLLPDGGYLDIDAVLDAAQKSNAGAIHPGYGFLSENSEFAKRVIKEKIVWVGPSPKVISVMGDKLKAKELAIKASVPTLPMTSDEKEVKKIGYPLLIKAAAGGGGKGMRIVEDKKEIKEAIAGAQREAKAGFNDDRVFIERYVPVSRHIEIQIMSDEHGNAVHFGERDCSMQRRNQKIIEETQACGIERKEIDKIGAICAEACVKLGYTGAGTFEFLYQDGQFSFIEMNTRIQVEHTVTEMVCMIDLVKEQIRTYAGIELSMKQEDITMSGHAIECRINAEDPFNDFIPSPKKIDSLNFAGGIGVRIDSFIYAGYQIPTNYDSMLGKLIVHSSSRENALIRMKRSIQEIEQLKDHES